MQSANLIAPASVSKMPKSVNKHHGLNAYTLIMGAGVIVFTALVVPLLSGAILLNKFLHERASQNPQSSWRPSKPSDLLYGLILAVFFGVIQYSVEALSYPFFYDKCKERNNEKLREKKARKSATVFFKSLFYLGFVLYEFYYFLDAPWFPTFLGGNCQLKDVFPMLLRNNPEVVIDQPYMREFYLAQIGFRVGDLVVHSFFKKDKQTDHLEMLLHHIVALALHVSTFLANIQPMGALAMVYHDISDVLSSPLRVWADSVYSKSAWIGPFYVFFLIVYFVSRCLALPYLVIVAWRDGELGGPDFPQGWWMKHAMCSYLSVLCLLHWYWLRGLATILTKYIKLGVTEDELNKTQ